MVIKTAQFWVYQNKQYQQQNAMLLVAFAKCIANKQAQYSQYFINRFENINIRLDDIPELRPIILLAKMQASKILQRPIASLRLGFWFNTMGPGDITVKHTHAEEDELLSAVYYLKVPEQSGELMLDHEFAKTIVSPEVGRYVFFPPSLAHWVTENKSQGQRISVAFNFGPLGNSQ